MLKLFSYLPGERLRKCRQVCQAWSQVGSDLSLWHDLFVRSVGKEFFSGTWKRDQKAFTLLEQRRHFFSHRSSTQQNTAWVDALKTEPEMPVTIPFSRGENAPKIVDGRLDGPWAILLDAHDRVAIYSLKDGQEVPFFSPPLEGVGGLTVNNASHHLYVYLRRGELQCWGLECRTRRFSYAIPKVAFRSGPVIVNLATHHVTLLHPLKTGMERATLSTASWQETTTITPEWRERGDTIINRSTLRRKLWAFQKGKNVFLSESSLLLRARDSSSSEIRRAVRMARGDHFQFLRVYQALQPYAWTLLGTSQGRLYLLEGDFGHGWCHFTRLTHTTQQPARETVWDAHFLENQKILQLLFSNGLKEVLIGN